MSKITLSILTLVLSFGCASGSIKRGIAGMENRILNGETLSEATLDDIANQVQPGTVVLISENHSHKPHHQNQVRLLERLGAKGFKISVGMEFFATKDQRRVDRYLAGNVDEQAFLKSIEWGKSDFADYRQQVLFPRKHGGTTLALNASRDLSGAISKVGLAGLTPAQKSLLPKKFEVGNDAYRERFNATMSGHVKLDDINRYFEAQSVWDDVMAEAAVSYLKTHADHVLVILVGDFHVIYSGGLPDRLHKRGQNRILNVSQVMATNSDRASLDAEIQPHPKWGARADFVWITP